MKFYVDDEAFKDIAILAQKCGNERVVLFDKYREPQDPKSVHVDIAVSGGDTASFCAEFSGRKYFIRQYHVTDMDEVLGLQLREKIENDGAAVYDRNTFSDNMIEHDFFYAPVHVKDVGSGGGERFIFWDESGNETVIPMVGNVITVYIVCDDREINGQLWDALEKSQLIFVREGGETSAIPLDKCNMIEFTECRKTGR